MFPLRLASLHVQRLNSGDVTWAKCFNWLIRQRVRDCYSWMGVFFLSWQW